MWLSLIVLFIAGCLYLYLDTVKPKKFPPGPRWLPIIGCAYQVLQLRIKTGYMNRTVNILSEAHDNTPLLGLRLGKDTIVMVNSLEANKEMLFNEDINGRPKGILYQTRTWGKRLGILLTDGETWKEQRTFLLKHLKEFGLGRRGMDDIIQQEAHHMVDDVTKMIDKNDGFAEFEVPSFFKVYVLNTLWMMMAGKRYNPNNSQVPLLLTLLSELFGALNMIGGSFSHFPVLSVLAPNASVYRRFIDIHKKLWKFFKEELSSHEEKFDSDIEDMDYMDAYIRVLRDRGEVSAFSQEQLMAMCLDLFVAGSETTNNCISFGFCYLVRQQELQKKAQEEIDCVVGKERFPCLDDRKKMPFMEALVLESMRHFIGRGFGVPHRAMRDTTLAGFCIPKDTMVVSNYSHFLMDERFFSNPQAFDPDRFLPGGRLVVPECYFPFGLGKRRCMGEALAKCNIFLFMTTMLQRFSFLPAPGEPLPSVEHVDAVTPSPAPFKVTVVHRI